MKKFITALFSLFILLTPFYAQAALTTNITGYWNLDENTGTTAADATGNGNTGTLVNGFSANPTWTSGGKINSGIVFSNTGGGAGNTVPVVSTANSGSFSAGAFTVSGWIYPTSNITTQDYGIFSNWYPGTQSWFVELGYSVSGNIRFYTAGLSNTSWGPNYSFLANTWYYVTFEWDGTTKYFYVNGSLVSSISATGTLAAGSTSPFNIGMSHGSSALYHGFDGIIDEVGFWSRALTATEITQLYNSGAGFQYPFLPAPARKMRLFEGFKIKIVSGKILINQQ